MRIFKTNVLLRFVNSYIIDSPQPANLSYLWNFGSLLALCLILQILTGCFLAMHYVPNVDLAFDSVEHAFVYIFLLCTCLLFKVNIFKNQVLHFLFKLNYIFLNNVNQFSSPAINTEIINSKNLHLQDSSQLHNQFTLFNNIKKNTDFNVDILNSISEESIFEWFRGFTDGEGCFEIVHQNSKFYFRFTLYLHKDDSPMLNYICNKLKVGKVFEREHFSTYYVISSEVLKIIEIFDKYPLNTSKHLNYLAFKEAYLLYSDNIDKDIKKVSKKILALKDSMNKKRVKFEMPSNHSIKITPYWLLGFIEGEGYFSVATKGYQRLEFGIGQTLNEVSVLEAIKQFLLNLPGTYNITRVDNNIIGLNIDKKPKNENSKPMAKIQIYKTDYINNVLIPFLDSLNWLSKKKIDYIDWKLILTIKNEGKHFTEQGKEVIYLISKRMNRNRLSTNLTPHSLPQNLLEEKIFNILNEPSNYEIQSNGKILVKSTGVYLKGRGNIKLEILDDKNLLFKSFNSIKECALFLGVSERTINRRLEDNKPFLFEGNHKLKIKRLTSVT